MIDRTHPLPMVRQCQLLELSRSTAYDQPTPVSAEDLALRRRLDELHLEYPLAGARRLSTMLPGEGRPVGPRRVSTRMKRMGIHAVYCPPAPASGIPRIGGTRSCSAIWRLLAQTRSGRRISPTFR